MRRITCIFGVAGVLALAGVTAGMFAAFGAAIAPTAAPVARPAAPADGVVIEGMPAGLLAPASPCKTEEIPESVTRKAETVLLNIPDRTHAPERPPEGWCGEVAIQEALLYHGMYFPQREINRAGRPQHPDLYAEDIPVALKTLRAKFEMCSRESRNFPAFLAWMKREIAAGRPVFTGVKINPTEHEEWLLDHFILAVGFTGDSLMYNTTWNKQESRTEKDLFSSQPGFSFKNRLNQYCGISILGPAGLGEGFAPVRLFVRKEEGQGMNVVVKCDGLQPGARYVAYRISSYEQRTARPLAVFDAQAPVFAFHDTINSGEAAIFRCRKADGAP